MAEDKDRPAGEPPVEPQTDDAKKQRTLHGHRTLSDAPPAPAATPSPRPTTSTCSFSPKPPRVGGWTAPGVGGASAPGAKGPIVRSKTPPPLQRVSPVPPAASPQRTVMYGTKIDEHTEVEQAAQTAEPIEPEEAELIEEDEESERPTNADARALEKEEKTEPNKASSQAAAAPTTPGATAPGATAPGATAPGATAPGATAPGATSSGTTREHRSVRPPVEPGRSSRPQSVSPGAYTVTAGPTFAGAAAGKSDAPPPPSSKEAASPLEKELIARADRVKADDPVGAARARVEAGLVCEWMLADREQARAHYAAARSLVRTLHPALARLRRIGAAQGAISGSSAAANEVLSVLDDELAIAETDELRSDLHAARARAYESLGSLPKARAAYAEALRFGAKHPAALRGLEVILRREVLDDAKPLHGDLAGHLIKLCEAFAPDGADGDAALSAWLCVERAELSERHLKDPAAARESLKRGVALAPAPGPVRSALVRHLAKHDRDAGLAEALRVEADRETDPDRAARLLYASARISLDRLNARGDGMASLVRADQRAVKGSPSPSS